MHKDVLDAQPEDDAAKEKLVEELRNRAKAAVADKAWPIADALYGKAIEVTPEPQASLFSNRSMARLSMGKFAEALNDAEALPNPHIKHLYTDVYDEMPWFLEEQQAELKDHLTRYREHYTEIPTEQIESL